MEPPLAPNCCPNLDAKSCPHAMRLLLLLLLQQINAHTHIKPSTTASGRCAYAIRTPGMHLEATTCTHVLPQP